MPDSVLGIPVTLAFCADLRRCLDEGVVDCPFRCIASRECIEEVDAGAVVTPQPAHIGNYICVVKYIAMIKNTKGHISVQTLAILLYSNIYRSNGQLSSNITTRIS